MKKKISISLIAAVGLTVSSVALSGGGIPGSLPANDRTIGKIPSHVYGRLPTLAPSRAMSSQRSSGRIPQSFPAHSTALGKMPSQARDRQPSFPPSRSMGQPIGTQSTSSQSTQGTSRIPQSFPAHNTAIGKMPSQASDRQPGFPPSRAMSQPGGAQTHSMPSMMPDMSTQGTNRIPDGPGRDGFNNRGRR